MATATFDDILNRTERKMHTSKQKILWTEYGDKTLLDASKEQLDI